MADFVHPTTLEVVLSENDRPAPWVVIARADALTALAIPSIYRKWVTDHVAEMTVGEKATVDAAIEMARRTAEAAKYDAKEILRAQALVLIDEINNLRQWIESFKTATAAATSLADLKTRVAGLSSMPNRTPTQARTAIVNKLGGL